MVRVERGNVVLDIDKHEVDHYLTLGFNVIDDMGRIVRAAVPTSLGKLQAEYVANQIEIANLQAEVERLNAEIAEFKSAAKAGGNKKSAKKNSEE